MSPVAAPLSSPPSSPFPAAQCRVRRILGPRTDDGGGGGGGEGKVVVALDNGLEGIIERRDLSSRPTLGSLEDYVSVGQVITARIMSVRPQGLRQNENVLLLNCSSEVRAAAPLPAWPPVRPPHLNPPAYPRGSRCCPTDTAPGTRILSAARSTCTTAPKRCLRRRLRRLRPPVRPVRLSRLSA